MTEKDIQLRLTAWYDDKLQFIDAIMPIFYSKESFYTIRDLMFDFLKTPNKLVEHSRTIYLQREAFFKFID